MDMDGNAALALLSWLRPAVRHSGKRIMWVCPVLVVAALWEIIARSGAIDESVLPAVTTIAVACYDLVESGEVLLHLVTSIYRALAGLALGSVVGITLGILMASSRLVRDLIDPLITLTFPLPKAAFIPITLLWLGVGNASSILMVFLSTLVPMIISARDGAHAVHMQLIWSAQAMGASRLRVLASVIVPAALPYIANGLRIALAFSMVVVVSTEMVAAHIGIGKFVLLFGEGGNYDYMFAAVLIVVGVAFLLDRCFLLIVRRLLQWTEGSVIQ